MNFKVLNTGQWPDKAEMKRALHGPLMANTMEIGKPSLKLLESGKGKKLGRSPPCLLRPGVASVNSGRCLLLPSLLLLPPARAAVKHPIDATTVSAIPDYNSISISSGHVNKSTKKHPSSHSSPSSDDDINRFSPQSLRVLSTTNRPIEEPELAAQLLWSPPPLLLLTPW